MRPDAKARPAIIRGPSLKILAREAEGIHFREALRRAEEGGFAIASNPRLYRFLLEISKMPGLHPLRCALPCRSGTVGAYAEPGVPFNESKLFSKGDQAMVFTDTGDEQRYVFPVPDQCLSLADALLLLEHPDYTLVPDGKSQVISPYHDSSIVCIKKFPPKNDFYKAEGEHGIPCGEACPQLAEGSRLLFRLPEGAIVTVVCGTAAHPQFVGMDKMLSENLPSLVEALDEKPEPLARMIEPPRREFARIEGISPEALQAMLAGVQGCLETLEGTVGMEKLGPIRELLSSLAAKK